MKKYQTVTLTIVFFVLSISQTYAWGLQGHRIVGELASGMLSCSANKKITRVLSNSSIAMAANWGDFVKSDSVYAKFSIWHYTNLDANLTRSRFDSAALSTDNGECIYRVIYLTDYLRQHPDDAQMLKLLIHIVGDMFQPLHLGRTEDLGGNKIEIKWFGQPTNLHSLWDNKLIDGQKLSYTEYAQYLRSIYKPRKTKYSENVVLQSAWDTYTVTNRIYNTIAETSKPYRYIYDYENVWEKQLVEGAKLLATILDYIY